MTSITQNFMMEEFSSSDKISLTSILASCGDSCGSDGQISSIKGMSACKINKWYKSLWTKLFLILTRPSRDGGVFWNMGGGGGLSFTQPCTYPYLDFPNALSNIRWHKQATAVLTVLSVSVINLWPTFQRSLLSFNLAFDWVPTDKINAV